MNWQTAKLAVNINEDMIVEEVHMEGSIAEKEACFRKVDKQFPMKLDTGEIGRS